MNLEITAITLSAKPAACAYADISYLNQVQTIQNCTDYNHAFYSAIEKVQTPFFFFLDDDDELPEDYLSVLADCIRVDCAVAYTDEKRINGGVATVARGGEYSKEKHLANPLMLHHAVLCKTSTAKKALPFMPKGQFWPEMPLYFDLAQESVAYVPRTGYLWNRADGLSSTADVSIGQVRSRIWCGGAP
jgi:hypothetical protein